MIADDLETRSVKYWPAQQDCVCYRPSRSERSYRALDRGDTQAKLTVRFYFTGI